MATVQNPASLGGQPQTMTTNNWWDGVSAAVKDGVDLAVKATEGYVQLRQAKDVIASRTVAARNRAPGMFGLNPQADGVIGAGQDEGVMAGVSPVVLGVAVLAIVALVVMVRK